MTHLLAATAALGAMLACAEVASGAVTPVVVSGDPVPGSSSQVTTIGSVAIANDGTWYVEFGTDNIDPGQDLVILAPTGVFEQEGEPVSGPSGATVFAFGTLDVGPAGSVAQTLVWEDSVGLGTGLYLNQLLLLEEGAPVGAVGAPPASIYTGLAAVEICGPVRLLLRTTIDDGSDPRPALVVLDVTEREVVESIRFMEDLLLSGAGVVNGVPLSPTDFAINSEGDILTTVTYLAEPTSEDGAIVLFDASTGAYSELAREGAESPVADRPWAILYEKSLDLNGAGDYVFNGQLSGLSNSNQLLVVNGAPFKQEGDVVTTGNGTWVLETFGSGPLLIDPAANVVWYAEWSGPVGTDSGIFLNETLLAQSGVTTFNDVVIAGELFDDVVLASIGSHDEAMHLSSDGTLLIFEGALRHPETLLIYEAAFIVPMPDLTLCEADINGNDDVGFADLAALLVSWGPCVIVPECPTDVDGNGTVGFNDLTIVLTSWGACP